MTFEKALTGIGDHAIIEAAGRFITGDVQAQSKTFAPSVAEFVAEARKRHEFISIAANKDRPRLSDLSSRSYGPRPFEVAHEKAMAKFAGCPILHRNIGHDQWMKMSKAREIPDGSVWSAQVGIIFGPPAEEISMGRRRKQAAE